MSWHYQVVRSVDADGHEHFAIHESYDGDLTLSPVTFEGMSPEDVMAALNLALADCAKHGVVDCNRDPQT